MTNRVLTYSTVRPSGRTSSRGGEVAQTDHPLGVMARTGAVRTVLGELPTPLFASSNDIAGSREENAMSVLAADNGYPLLT